MAVLQGTTPALLISLSLFLFQKFFRTLREAKKDAYSLVITTAMANMPHDRYFAIRAPGGRITATGSTNTSFS